MLDEEVGYILDMGVDVRYNSPITSMHALLDEGFDAVFVGSGAPKGKDLDIPGREDQGTIHIGIEWLANVHFGHVEQIGERVLIIGVGNTAMDCCRTSKRLGGRDIKVIARRSRPYFKASPWELEDAEEEGVEIVENHAPKRFVIEDGTPRRDGVRAAALDRAEWQAEERSDRDRRDPLRRRHSRDRPGQRLPVDRARPRHRVRRERHAGRRRLTMQSTRPGVFFGGDAAWGPENIIWAVEHGHQAAISIHNHCQDVALTDRPPHGMNLVSAKVGMHAWSYSNDYSPVPRSG